MTRASAWIVAITAFIAGLLILGSLVFRSSGSGAGFGVLALALTVVVFGMLSGAARGFPGSAFLKAGFIGGVATFVLTVLVPLIGLAELSSMIGVLLWPITLVLVAVGLLKSRFVPPFAAWLAGAWGVLVALRAVATLWVPLQLPGAEAALVVVPAVVGALFSAALGVGVLARSNEAQ